MATEKDFKEVMSRWATGISVITTTHDDEWRGFTANSFASVSIDPFLISMSVAKTVDTLEYLQGSGVFAVNILRKSQKSLGVRFAGFIPEYEDNRFRGLDISLSENGCPLLPDVLGYMDCKVYKEIDLGASIMFLGQVTGTYYTDGEPLIYWHRQWGEFKSQE